MSDSSHQLGLIAAGLIGACRHPKSGRHMMVCVEFWLCPRCGRGSVVQAQDDTLLPSPRNIDRLFQTSRAAGVHPDHTCGGVGKSRGPIFDQIGEGIPANFRNGWSRIVYLFVARASFVGRCCKTTYPQTVSERDHKLRLRPIKRRPWRPWHCFSPESRLCEADSGHIWLDVWFRPNLARSRARRPKEARNRQSFARVRPSLPGIGQSVCIVYQFWPHSVRDRAGQICPNPCRVGPVRPSSIDVGQSWPHSGQLRPRWIRTCCIQNISGCKGFCIGGNLESGLATQVLRACGMLSRKRFVSGDVGPLRGQISSTPRGDVVRPCSVSDRCWADARATPAKFGRSWPTSCAAFFNFGRSWPCSAVPRRARAHARARLVVMAPSGVVSYPKSSRARLGWCPRDGQTRPNGLRAPGLRRSWTGSRTPAVPTDVAPSGLYRRRRRLARARSAAMAHLLEGLREPTRAMSPDAPRASQRRPWGGGTSGRGVPKGGPRPRALEATTPRLCRSMGRSGLSTVARLPFAHIVAMRETWSGPIGSGSGQAAGVVTWKPHAGRLRVHPFSEAEEARE